MIKLEDIKKDYNYKIKLILLGKSESGKTSFFTRLIYNNFSLTKSYSIGIEIGTKFYETRENRYKVEIWDTMEENSTNDIYINKSLGKN